MPRSIQGFKPKALSQDHRFYSDDDIEAIIAAAGGTVRARVPGLRRRQALTRLSRFAGLSECLERAAHNYMQCSQFQTEPTPIQIADTMADIEAAAAKLIVALHLPEAMDEDPITSMPAALRSGALQAQAALEAGHGLPKRSGAGLLRDSVHGVYRLQRWSQNVQARLRTAQATPRAKRHVGDEELDRLFGDLASIWTGIFKRRIATAVSGGLSANSGEAGGPMVRFFSTCLKPILKDKTPNGEGIRLRIRRLLRVRHLPRHPNPPPAPLA